MKKQLLLWLLIWLLFIIANAAFMVYLDWRIEVRWR